MTEDQPCPYCEPTHTDPWSRPWSVWVSTELRGDGKPGMLTVAPSGAHHVAESDAAWLRGVLQKARREHFPRMWALPVTDVYNIKGRGTIAVGKPHGDDPKVGDYTIVHEQEYLVTGVEMFMKLTNPPIKGDSVGLLLRGDPPVHVGMTLRMSR